MALLQQSDCTTSHLNNIYFFFVAETDKLRSVLSPVAAQPGREPDTIDELRKKAIQSTLLLGRAVSVPDFEALASQALGVLRASAEFLWLDEEQRAGVQVTYIGDSSPQELTYRLRELAEPDLPILVHKAKAIPRSLSLSIEVDSRRKADDVAAALRAALIAEPDGFLSHGQASIGGQFWASQLFAAVHAVPGVISVQHAALRAQHGAPLDLDGASVLCVPAGSYFDFAAGENLTISTTPARNVVDVEEAC